MLQLFRANVDLYETDREVVAKFDIPGVREDDITVSVENDSLIVSVEKTAEREERKENAFLSERSYSGYYRSISLPPEADQDNVSANYDNGVLTVRFPIREGIRGSGGRSEAGRRTGEIPVSRQSISGGGMGRGRSEVGAFQPRLSRDEMMRQGTDSPIYRSGSGTYYSDTFERPSGEAAPEAYFGEGNVPVSREASVSRREAEVARREAEVARREMEISRSTGTVTAGGPAPFQPRLSRDEMMRQGTDSPMYRSGSGSYYSDTFEKPTGDTSPQSSFSSGSGPGEVERRRKGRTKGQQ